MLHLEFTTNFRQAPDPLQDGLFRYLMNAVSFIVATLPMVPGEFWIFNPIPLRFHPFAPRRVFKPTNHGAV